MTFYEIPQCILSLNRIDDILRTETFFVKVDYTNWKCRNCTSVKNKNNTIKTILTKHILHRTRTKFLYTIYSV